MADDNRLRSYHSNDPYRHGGRTAQEALPAADPLAELARLIGQPDPFADDGRGHAPQGQAAPRASRYGDDLPADDWRRHVQRPNFDLPDEPDYAAAPLDRGYDRHDAADYSRAPATDYSAPDYATPDYDAYRMASPQADDGYAEDRDGYHSQRFGAADDAAAAVRAAPEYYGEQPPRRHGAVRVEEEDYDDPPRRARGSSLATAVVLIGCAMLGTAGAYGYRTYATSSASKQAPVIVADTAPSKIVPNGETKAPRSQERVGPGGDERLVSREEQPVTLPTPGTQQVPRVVFPALVQPNQTAPSTTGTTPPSASNAQASVNQPSTEPKRVRTVTIRPDGGDAPSAADPRNAPPSGRSQPTARSTPPSAAPPPRASRDQPLSLDPGAPAQPVDSRAPPQQRPLTPPAPRETTSPAPRVAAAPSSGGGSGGYLVQVSSQRSEADAQSSYRALQTKYSQLRSRQPIIRRADLGAKGVYYRAMVGPFDSPGEADQFCSGLKQAGGQCIILRN